MTFVLLKRFIKPVLVIALFSITAVKAEAVNSAQPLYQVETAKSAVDIRLEPMITDQVKPSFIDFAKLAPIAVQINTDLDDGAQAAREYIDFSVTTKCTISVNPGYYIFKEEVNPMLRMGFTIENIRSLLLLHELAHCVDSEPAPKGVDAVAWREALSDAYAVSMLYHTYQLSIPKIAKLAVFRNSNENGGAHKMLMFLLSRLKHDPDQTIDPVALLNTVKALRRQAFAAV